MRMERMDTLNNTAPQAQSGPGSDHDGLPQPPAVAFDILMIDSEAFSSGLAALIDMATMGPLEFGGPKGSVLW